VALVARGEEALNAAATTIGALAVPADTGSDDSVAAMVAAVRDAFGRFVTAAEVADVIAFLASPRSVAINGDAIAVGGGAKGAIHY
jgi:NAD(P)-dependent dehydrogenase (short-subunit alcohol dehydrogenase family)